MEAVGAGGLPSLLIASRYGHLSVVRELLAGGADIEETEGFGRTSLIAACQSGSDGIDVVRELLDRGANIEAATISGETSLIAASQCGCLSVVRELLARGANVEAATCSCSTSLYLASFKGYVDIVRALLARGANTEAAVSDGATSLYIACRFGYHDVVHELLARGANTEAATSSGATSLCIASQKGHLDVVRELLARGANVEAARRNGCTSLYIASYMGHRAVVEELLARGANTETATRSGATSLFIASYRGRHAVVRELLACGANTEAVTTDGATSLYIASGVGNVAVVRELLARGANPRLAARDGSTARSEAKTDAIRAILDDALARPQHALPEPRAPAPAPRALAPPHAPASAPYTPAPSSMPHAPVSAPAPRAFASVSSATAVAADADTDVADPFWCAICLSTISDESGGPAAAACGAHVFCVDCLRGWVSAARSGAPTCPTCRLPIQRTTAEVRVNVAIRAALAARIVSAVAPAPPAPPSAPAVPWSSLERTDVEKGQGAYGIVRVYRWPSRGIQVAVKELKPDALDALDDDAIVALAAEAALQARLSHPHVVRVFGWAADAATRRYGLVMQLYEGSLQAALREGGLPLDARLALAVQAAAGLLYLHSEGVVHGDVKPANVLLLGGAAALTDFGTAASAARAAASASAGARGAGTPQFMAPELHEMRDSEPVHGPSRAADVYALACTVYCAAVGAPLPWASGFKPSAVRAGARPPLDRLPPGLPPDLPALLLECWAEDRRARPAVPAVLARLRAVLAALGGAAA